MRPHKHSPRRGPPASTLPPPDPSDPVQTLLESAFADAEVDDDDEAATHDARTAGEYAETALGENWVETLETRAAEGGPSAEREIEANDDQDRDVHHGSKRDRPVADKGSGGPAGL
jgi:hypothetical protein